jgi:hypothetical protein
MVNPTNEGIQSFDDGNRYFYIIIYIYILAYVYAIILESIKQGLFKHIPALRWVVWILVLQDDYMHMYIHTYIYIYIAPQKKIEG